MNRQSNYDITKLQIAEITIINAQINNNSELTDLPKNKYMYGLNYQFQIATNAEGKRIRLIHSTEVDAISKENNSVIPVNGKFSIAYYFILDNFHEVFDGDPIQVSDEIAKSLINICYPTTRGIMFKHCQGTIMKNLLLPILPTTEIEKLQKELFIKPKIAKKGK